MPRKTIDHADVGVGWQVRPLGPPEAFVAARPGKCTGRSSHKVIRRYARSSAIAPHRSPIRSHWSGPAPNASAGGPRSRARIPTAHTIR